MSNSILTTVEAGQSGGHMHVPVGLARKRRIALIILAAAVLVSVYLGWRLFWFLTDDSFIDFRYISNSHFGLGYVWNAPPFRPVEGYTSFLWVVLLDYVWRLTGIEPPDSSTYVSLFFSYLTLLTGSLMVLKMNLRPEFGKRRILFLTLILVGVISNRTFLAWTSSGLEAAMFNFFFTLWIFCCLYLPAQSKRWLFGVTVSATLVCLTRPDGLLITLVTLLLVGHAIYCKARERKLAATHFILCGSLLLIPAHLLWRHAFYGAWLPNTYYAKTVPGRFWLEAGMRYSLSFAQEYSLWVWLAALVALIGIKLRHRPFSNVWAGVSLAQAAVIFALVAHFLYYTIVIGGDHFEYRVYSHLIPLIFISFLWILNSLPINAGQATLTCCLFIVLSWPIPWIHWAASHKLSSRKLTSAMKTSVADTVSETFPHTPNLILGYLRAFDATQFWLIDHLVCVRHQEHKVACLSQRNHLPDRAQGMQLSAAGYPVLTVDASGMVSWVLPKIYMLDVMGLNDYVVARNADLRKDTGMAHERQPPAGYVECFDPNVNVIGKQVTIRERSSALTPEKIAKCEQSYAALVSISIAPAPRDSTQNPIDNPEFFVRRLYLDALSRRPDLQGPQLWTKQLDACGDSRSLCRADVADGFFLSAEFRQRGNLLIASLYRVSFGARPSYLDFMRERNKLENYDTDELEREQDLLLREWITRDYFRQTYPETMTPDDFVNRLFDYAGLRPFATERRQQIDAMRAGSTRVEVLRSVIGFEEAKSVDQVSALILPQYFILLRHDISDGEYQFLLDRLKIDKEQGYRTVTCLLLTSGDYQRRFGAAVTHSQEECNQ